MATQRVQELYERYVKALPDEQKLELIKLTTSSLAPNGESADKPKRSIMELHGLGAEIWQGLDAQEYVNRLRNEWDRPT
jgi:hypothetical protein